MNQAPRNLSAFKPIDLAAEADFALGGVRVCPSVREVQTAEGHETVEPRVMQVLVALARADGAVVSRDQLIERCWGGRLVGDDAINSCVAKVRALAELAFPPAFEIETVPRVGYKLRTPTVGVANAPIVLEPPRKFIPATRSLLVWSGAVLAIAVAAIVVLLSWKLSALRAEEWVIVESHQPFISTPLIERYPAFSPDGTMIAYARGRDIYSRQIFLQLRSGGDAIQLTHDPFDASAPAWSPDGTVIAYLAYEERRPCRIMLAQPPSGPSHQIGRCRTAERSSLSWDRDGHALFYSDSPRANEPMRIMHVDVDSGALSEITHPAAVGALSDLGPAISPDGKTLLFARSAGGGRQQIVLRALSDGSERVLLADDDDDDNAAAWSADSATVFVDRRKGTDSSLWSYPVSGAAPWRITSNAVPMSRLSSGPDGLLAMELEVGQVEVAVAPRTPGVPASLFDPNGTNACFFDYAPDGTLALIAHRSGTALVLTGRPGHLRELMRLKADEVCGISWSPDGSRLAYGDNKDGNFCISVIGRDGAPLARLRDPSSDFGGFSWSADGKGLLMSRLDRRGWRTWRVDLARPGNAVVTPVHGWNFVREYRGAIFGAKPGTSGVWRIDGTPRRLTDWPAAEYAGSWTVADGKIVYADLSNPTHPVFMAQPVAGGARQFAGYADGLNLGSDVSVDPTTGLVSYVRWKRDDTDIGWIRLARQ